MTLDELKIIISAQTSGLTKEMNKVKKELSSLNSHTDKVLGSIKSGFKKLAVFVGALGIGKAIKDSFKEAYQVEAQINNMTRTLGENMVQFQNWVKNQAAGYGIAEAQAYKYGNTLSLLLGSYMNDTKQVASATTQLLEGAAIVASRTGLSIEDSLAKITSGIRGETEAIEDLGINVKTSAIEQSAIYQQLAGGAPWNQLSAEAQGYIRTMYILEQISIRYGNTMAGGVATQMMIFQAALSNLRTTLGQAFLPIANVILPFLTNFINRLRVAIMYVIAFMNVLFGVGKGAKDSMAKMDASAKSVAASIGGMSTGAGNTAKNLGKAATAARKLKGALQGFDEINLLNMPEPTPSSGAGAGAGGSVSIPAMDIPEWDDGGFTEGIEEFNAQMDEIQVKVEAFVSKIKTWLPIIAGLVAVFAGLWTLVNWGAVTGALANLAEKLAPLAADGFLNRIKMGLSNMFVGLSQAASAPLAVIAAVIALIVAIGFALVELWKTNEEFRNKVKETWDNIKMVLYTVWESFIKPIFENIRDVALAVWEKGLKPLWKKFVFLVGEIAKFMLDIWNAMAPVLAWVIETFGPGIVATVNQLVKWFGDAFILISDILGAFLEYVGNIIKGVRKIFEGIIDFIVGVFTGDWDRAMDGITKIFEGVKMWFDATVQYIKDIFGSIITFLKNTFITGWKTAWNTTKTTFKNIWNGVKEWFTGVFSGAWEAIKRVFSGVGTFFGGIWNTIKSKFTNIGSKIGNAVSGAFKSSINSVFSIIERTVNGFIRMINGAIKIINKIPGVNIGRVSEVKIPRLAKGGIVDSGQLFIAGEAGKEVIMPLENNTGWITQLAQQINAVNGNNAVSDRPLEVVLQVGTTEFGRIVVNSINSLTRQEGKLGIIV